MNFTTSTIKPSTVLLEKGVDLLVIPTVAGKLQFQLPAKHVLYEELLHALSAKDLAKKSGSTLLYYTSKNVGEKMSLIGQRCPTRVLLWEIGKTKLPSSDIKVVLKPILKTIVGYKKVGFILPSGEEQTTAEHLIIQVANSVFKYPGVKENRNAELESLVLASSVNVSKNIQKGKAISTGYSVNKLLAMLPANKLTPSNFAKHAQKIAKSQSLKVKVFKEKQLLALKMGGITGVSQGSTEDSCLIVLEHKPKAKKTIALVGKGITFDSGGISIKPSKDMHEMKFDMLGGATVLAMMNIASLLDLPIHLVGIIAASENLPGNNSVKPGDVITTYSKKTVEVINTDAEGRLVLCDALTYAQRNYKLDAIIDIATLTGAISVSLGNKITGAFGNNQSLNKSLETAAKKSGEDIHFLPLFEKYSEELNSQVADMTNIGKQRCDALIAALFLERFIEKNTPWVHLDIGATAWNNEGPTGVLLETLTELLNSAKL